MKRFFSLIMVGLLLCFPYGAWADGGEPLRIVATIFPGYDFARQIAGENAELTLLLPPGSDIHSFDPTPQDMIAIQNADLFIYNGGESDEWVLRLLESLGEDAPETFVMMDHVTAEVAGHDHDHDHDHGHHGEVLDEHVWTSPKNVMQIAAALCEKLCTLCPEKAETFVANEAAFQTELQKLDESLTELAHNSKRNLLIFGDRFPFRHLAAAYDFHYEAAFPGCSEDSEPSIKTIGHLVSIIREEEIPVVFHIEFSNRRTADILAEETGAKVLLLHSCHSVSAEDISSGVTYVSLMWQNVAALKEALN